MSRFRFSVGPWNVHEGADAYGPATRNAIPLEEKIRKFKEIGFDAIQFHDDDAVPDINNLSEAEIISEAKKVRALLDKYELEAEFVAPRLWMDPHTVDGGFTSNSEDDRNFALWRAFRSIDIAKTLGAKYIVLWLAREGTVCYESKDPVACVSKLVDAINQMLAYDPDIKIMIETKPNEPVDRSVCPTMGHAMAISAATSDPSRVGGLLESAHAMLAGLDPASEIAFAMSMGKLWGVHLNDQNGMKFDQDKSFGVENLRTAFNQIRVLMDNGFGKNGEYIGLDVKAMRTERQEGSYRHLENSLKIAKMLEAKAEKFDCEFRDKCIAERDYEALEMYVMELLMKG
ncbi:MAG: TIM barrel protein [Eubacteriales bacterium]